MIFRRKQEKGFTLIELLIVVVIISVLAAVAIPRFGTITRKAKDTEATKILRQIYTLEEGYYLENSNYTNLTNPYLWYETADTKYWSISLSLDSDSLGYTVTASETQDVNGDSDTDDTWSFTIARPDSLGFETIFTDS